MTTRFFTRHLHICNIMLLKIVWAARASRVLVIVENLLFVLQNPGD